MNIDLALKQATNILKKNQIDSAKLDAELLLLKIIKKDKKYIIIESKKDLDKKDYDSFNELINKRKKGEPIAYLINQKSFWNYDFYVEPGALIPRPDTELIVQEVLNLTKQKKKLSVLDIGIGSGCILLSILKERKSFSGTGIDLSKKSLKISKINAKRLGVKSRLKLFKSNIDNFNYGKYDLIVSNPPYIDTRTIKYLERDVKEFEPILALDGGLDGTSVISKVISKSSKLIKKNGKLVIEIAFNQKKIVKKLLIEKGFYINKVLKDYANKERCIVSTKI